MRCIKAKVTRSHLSDLNSVVAWYRFIRNDQVASGFNYCPISDSFARSYAKVRRDCIPSSRIRKEALTVA